MANVNKVILIGNVTRDPEIKYTPKGTAVTDLGLAINRFIPASEGGDRREETTFIDVTLWGRQAEIANEYLKKGRPVYIEGRLQMDSWEDKQTGQKRSKLRVVGENLQLLGSRDGGGSGGSRGGGEYDDPTPPRSRGGSAPPSRPPAEPEDDDIPF
jgi:single-strand DNA-binding protein